MRRWIQRLRTYRELIFALDRSKIELDLRRWIGAQSLASNGFGSQVVLTVDFHKLIYVHLTADGGLESLVQVLAVVPVRRHLRFAKLSDPLSWRVLTIRSCRSAALRFVLAFAS